MFCGEYEPKVYDTVTFSLFCYYWNLIILTKYRQCTKSCKSFQRKFQTKPSSYTCKFTIAHKAIIEEYQKSYNFLKEYLYTYEYMYIPCFLELKTQWWASQSRNYLIWEYIMWQSCWEGWSHRHKLVVEILAKHPWQDSCSKLPLGFWRFWLTRDEESQEFYQTVTLMQHSNWSCWVWSSCYWYGRNLGLFLSWTSFFWVVDILKCNFDCYSLSQ